MIAGKAIKIQYTAGKPIVDGPALPVTIVADIESVSGPAMPAIQVDDAYVQAQGLIAGDPRKVKVVAGGEILHGAIQPVFIVV